MGASHVINWNVRDLQLQSIVVTAEQMRAIEERVFAAGMPVAALMEKVAGSVARRMMALYPMSAVQRLGVLVGPGHNGGDALVVARELHLQGYGVTIFCPFARQKDLTSQHRRYCVSLGIDLAPDLSALRSCDLLLDGLFGFGLERSLEGAIADLIDQVNQWGIPILSIDLPSGLHTDTGQTLGTAIRASHTFCLGLWKLGLLQDPALELIGTAELIDIGLPLADIDAVLGSPSPMRRVTPHLAIAHIPLQRPSATHKYQIGHLLLIAGSHRYTGAAILAGLGARATGIGMLSIAVPASLKSILASYLPEALILACPETENGAIAELPDFVNLESYQAIACGPGLTKDAIPLVQQVLASHCPLVLDADGLNILADLGTIAPLKARSTATLLTPHQGEFKRLFPNLMASQPCRVTATQAAAAQTNATVLLKGARVIIAAPDKQVWINPASTPALARGGSGDVLTGLSGGLLAQAKAITPESALEAAQASAWWHGAAGILAATERTIAGVDPLTLTAYLIPALREAATRLGQP